MPISRQISRVAGRAIEEAASALVIGLVIRRWSAWSRPSKYERDDDSEINPGDSEQHTSPRCWTS